MDGLIIAFTQIWGSLIGIVDLLDHLLHGVVPIDQLRAIMDHHPIGQALEQPFEAGLVLDGREELYVMGLVKEKEHPSYVVLVGVAGDSDGGCCGYGEDTQKKMVGCRMRLDTH